MTKLGHKHVFSRRRFLQGTVSAATYMSGVFALPAVAQATSRQSQNDDEYRALVFIFLDGGNDAFNTIIPVGTGALVDNYQNNRGVLALPEAQLNPINLQTPAAVYGGQSHTDFAFHGDCSYMAEMFDNQEIAALCNIGNLVKPVTRAQYMAVPRETGLLPPRLFSHSDQQRQFQSEPTDAFIFGWGGRLGELITQYNTSEQLSALLSTNGLNAFQVTAGSDLNTYSLTKDGLPTLNDFTGLRSEMVNNFMAMNQADGHLMSRHYAGVFDSATTAQTALELSFAIADAKGIDFDDIFNSAGASPSSNIASSLKTVAKVIAGRDGATNKRPIFFVQMGGFDAHANLIDNHANLLSQLDSALKGFRDSITELGDFERVLTFVGSEFGRTLTPNGNSVTSSGTDHAWGGIGFAMGGQVDGGKLFGTFPDLAIEQGLDVGSRGRFIPGHSTSQCAAIMADWMGASSANIAEIFPTLTNFPSPFDPQTNINFLTSAEV